MDFSRRNRKNYLCCILPLGNNGECYGVRWAFFLIFIGTFADMCQGVYNLFVRFDDWILRSIYIVINLALWCGPWPFMLYAFKCWEDNYKNRPGYHFNKIETKSVKLKEDGILRIVCISDTHSLVENNQPRFDVPDGDILIHAGDFTNQGNLDKVMEFNSWLG